MVGEICGSMGWYLTLIWLKFLHHYCLKNFFCSFFFFSLSCFHMCMLNLLQSSHRSWMFRCFPFYFMSFLVCFLVLEVYIKRTSSLNILFSVVFSLWIICASQSFFISVTVYLTVALFFGPLLEFSFLNLHCPSGIVCCFLYSLAEVN